MHLCRPFSLPAGSAFLSPLVLWSAPTHLSSGYRASTLRCDGAIQRFLSPEHVSRGVRAWNDDGFRLGFGPNPELRWLEAFQSGKTQHQAMNG